MDEYNKKAEENLLGMKKQKEEADKRLLTIEIVMGLITMVMYLALVTIVDYVQMSDCVRLLIIVLRIFHNSFFDFFVVEFVIFSLSNI